MRESRQMESREKEMKFDKHDNKISTDLGEAESK